MPSQTQIDVNRLNSQKSTGPTSQEGKAASSLNVLKSGIHANSHIIHGEDPAALDALTAAFLLQFQPAGPNQLALVDTLVAAEWTQRHLRRIEAELWNSRDESLDPTYAELSDTPPNPTSPFPALGRSCPDALLPIIWCKSLILRVRDSRSETPELGSFRQLYFHRLGWPTGHGHFVPPFSSPAGEQPPVSQAPSPRHDS